MSSRRHKPNNPNNPNNPGSEDHLSGEMTERSNNPNSSSNPNNSNNPNQDVESDKRSSADSPAHTTQNNLNDPDNPGREIGDLRKRDDTEKGGNLGTNFSQNSTYSSNNPSNPSTGRRGHKSDGVVRSLQRERARNNPSNPSNHSNRGRSRDNPTKTQLPGRHGVRSFFVSQLMRAGISGLSKGYLRVIRVDIMCSITTLITLSDNPVITFLL